jgi:GT2 family glycosyltransferase
MNNIPQGITTKYPIIFIENTKNLGFAGGNNIDIRYALAKNDFDSIILLNNDTVINRNTISNLVSARLKFGEKAIYGGRIFYYSDPEKIWYDGGKLKEWKCRTSHLNMRKYKHEIKDITETKEVDCITFCCVLIPKIIIENIGLIDESYFMYFEDVDYSYIVRKSGYKLYHISNVNLWHKVSASVGEELHKSLNYLETISRVKFIIKRLPPLKKVTSFISVLSSKKNIMILLKYPLKRWN